jgi:hypothetical protein
MAALAAPTSWLERRVRVELRRINGTPPERDPGRRNGAVRGRENGASTAVARVAAVLGRENGALKGADAVARVAAVSRRENGASTAAEPAGPIAFRRPARALHAACAELLPGYSAASREPWRQSLLTAACLDARPRGGAPRHDAPPLIVEDVEQPSDVLCALWLARRSGLFYPGSPCGDGVGLRSVCEIVPAFAPSLAEERRAGVMEALRANAAWRAHIAARQR